MLQRVLVVEDHPEMLETCAEILQRAGYDVRKAGSLRAAEGILRTLAIDVLVTDMKMPKTEGLDLLRIAKEADPEIVVILMTGFPTVETAVEAMKFGASDYLMKPFSVEQLLAVVEGSLEKRRTREAYGLLRGQLRSSFTLSGIVGDSSRMFKLFDDIRKAASVDANALILGESGAGKELVAWAIHENSRRREGPFLPLNCAAIPENLLEAELFGYERGAFTGAHGSKEGLLEAADGGTLFFDEICELSQPLQAKLLRALEEGTVRRIGGRKSIPFDVRFITSTNRDIREEMRQVRFREDLFFRIDVIEIQVPPLRERRDDIPLLAAHFLDACSARYGKTVEGLSQEALECLMRYDWPGNVRELKNAVERAVAYAHGPFISAKELPDPVLKGVECRGQSSLHEWKERTLERLEREFVETALAEHGGNVTHAAKALGVHRSTLQRLMRRLHLSAA